jgi:hypothetical protein
MLLVLVSVGEVLVLTKMATCTSDMYSIIGSCLSNCAIEVTELADWPAEALAFVTEPTGSGRPAETQVTEPADRPKLALRFPHEIKT